MVAKPVAHLVVIVGETASGKSALALQLAEKFGGEIICADSWTVRREVNIGTAKPSKEEQRRIPHHLLDVAEPCEDFTAAVFKRLAKQAIEDIAGRGKLPIMAGGTGLYVDGVIYDFNFLPPGDRSQREALDKLSLEELKDQIVAMGIALKGIDLRNKRRLIRLIETGGAAQSRSQLRTNTLILGVSVPKDELRQRIELRVSKMVDSGLEQEVESLVDDYGWSCEALKGIGYKEWRDYFDGSATIEETKDKIIRATLGLAKRQRTWFKRNKSIHWISSEQEAVSLVRDFLA